MPCKFTVECNSTLRGQLFENFVVMDIIKSRLNKGEDSNFYFYRDSIQKEVDLICKPAVS
ncbi:MAG: DUF4143 domain-containing protein [Gammaproteobacteria bacterium]